MSACECGCGEPTLRSTARFLRGHHLRKDRASDEQLCLTWLNTYFPKTGFCELCGRQMHLTHWLLLSERHGRDRNLYREVCDTCYGGQGK